MPLGTSTTYLIDPPSTNYIERIEIMLKIFKKAAWTVLTTPIVVGISGMLHQDVAYSATKFCNQTSSKVYVAYARGETYGGQANLPPGVGQAVSDVSTIYNVRGWWGLNPGACATPTNEAANQIVRGNSLYYVSHRYYARAVDANNYWTNISWEGNEQFCIRNAVFGYFRSVGGFAPVKPLVCSPDDYPAGFRSFTSTKANRTINLTGG
jgi:hypothetical protein